VDHGRNAAQDDDIVAFAQTGLEVFGRNGAEFSVVAGDIDVLDGGVGQAAVNDGDEGTGLLGETHGLNQRIGFEWQHDESVDLLHRDQVFDVRGLVSRAVGGDEGDFHIRVQRFDTLFSFLGVVVEATGPAVRRGRNGN